MVNLSDVLTVVGIFSAISLIGGILGGIGLIVFDYLRESNGKTRDY